jgi:hypothetical protein
LSIVKLSDIGTHKRNVTLIVKIQICESRTRPSWQSIDIGRSAKRGIIQVCRGKAHVEHLTKIVDFIFATKCWAISACYACEVGRSVVVNVDIAKIVVTGMERDVVIIVEIERGERKTGERIARIIRKRADIGERLRILFEKPKIMGGCRFDDSYVTVVVELQKERICWRTGQIGHI